jgi:hypothetical protein
MTHRAYYVYWPLDVRFPDVPTGHELRITGIPADDYALRVEHRIRPAVEASPGWDWEATDEQGRTYDQAGGAYGPLPDGQETDGVLSLVPFPPPGRHTLRFD